MNEPNSKKPNKNGIIPEKLEIEEKKPVNLDSESIISDPTPIQAETKKSSVEKFIGEMLMQTKSLSSKFWNILVTDKGVHFISFHYLPIFEIIILVLIWLSIFLVMIFSGLNQIALLTSLLLLIAIIYILDKHKIRNRWEKFQKMSLKEKIFSSPKNIHHKKEDIRKVFADKETVIISTNTKMYKFFYYEDGVAYYRNGIDPFQRDDARKTADKRELILEKLFCP